MTRALAWLTRLPGIAGMIQRRRCTIKRLDLRNKLQEIRDSYANQFEKARDELETQSVVADLLSETREYDEQLDLLETIPLLAEAGRLGTEIPADLFFESYFHDFRALSSGARAQAVRLISESRRRFWREWFAVVTPITSVVVAALSLLVALFAMNDRKRSEDYTHRVVERPYVVMTSMQPTNFAVGGTPAFIVTIQNVGRTAATGVILNVTLDERRGPLPAELPIDRERTEELPPIPGGMSRYRWIARTSAFTTTDASDLHSGKRRLYVFGFISYKDASGVVQYPQTEYCLVFNPDPARPNNANLSVGLFDPCPEGHNH